MSDSSLSRMDHLKLWFVAHVVKGIIHTTLATCRIHCVCGAEHLDALVAKPSPVVLSFWHDRAFFFTGYLYNRLIRRGVPTTLMTSWSPDGELATKLSRLWRAKHVRGSASTGAVSGLRGLHRAVMREGSSIVNMPDGPRGPAHRFKPGTVMLARLCRIPVLPLAFAADRYWNLNSWDALVIPKPFARVLVAVGGPQVVPYDLPDDGLEGERLRLEGVMNDLLRDVEAQAVGPAAGAR